jgi:hypothetical protein
MSKQKKLTIQAVAARLVGGKPVAHKLREDGSLAVIGPDGRKFCFSADQVRAAREPEDSVGTKQDEKDGQG